jgi:SAM-dependent methyltransferase
MPNWKYKVFVQRLLWQVPFGEHVNFMLQAVRRSSRSSARGLAAEIHQRLAPVGGSIRRLSGHLRLEEAAVVEVGTGWAPLPTVLLYLAGARSIHTYDIVRRARWSAMSLMIRALRNDIEQCADALGQPRPAVEQRLARIEGATSMKQMLDLANITYVAPGDASATGLPDGSIDLYFAYSVFENVPLPVLHAFCREARRVLRPGSGRLCATLGCGDDYAGFDKKLHMLDYLKYSDQQWDRLVNRYNRYYYNRLREQEYLDILREHGATVDAIQHRLRAEDVEYVKTIPLAERFRRFTPEQNAVVNTEVIASFAG